MTRKMDTATELRRLERLTVTELGELYTELFGEPARSRNRQHLLRRVGWRIQANASGGLSERAVLRIAELGDAMPDRWQERATSKRKTRDPRLPLPGTILRRTFGEREHEVVVLEDGFRYEGELFDSLSTVANRITGSRWNGFAFFGLGREET